MAFIEYVDRPGELRPAQPPHTVATGAVVGQGVEERAVAEDGAAEQLWSRRGLLRRMGEGRRVHGRGWMGGWCRAKGWRRG